MKILPIAKIREADAYTIKHEPVSDIDLMERAATELYEWIMANAHPDKKFMIYCGMGNNGGDGFAADCILRRISNTRLIRVFCNWYRGSNTNSTTDHVGDRRSDTWAKLRCIV